MPTVRLIPSTYYLSSSSYLSVSDASNMYHNTDNTTHSTVTNSRTSTTSYYIYLRGFNFNDVPSNAIVNSFTVKVKCNHSGGYAQAMYLYNGTSTSMGSSDSISTTVTTHTFDCDHDWDDLVSAGSNFGIRINCRRGSRNTTSYIYIYGAEILVDYTIPEPVTITSTLSGNGTIVPSGAYSTYKNTEYTLTITPTNSSDTVTATNNGVDVTNQLVAHGSGGEVTSVLGTFTLSSGGFNGSGQSYFEGIVGHGVNATQTTSNYYSSSSSTQAIFTYNMAVDIPLEATVTRVWCEVNGHAESTSQSSEYMCVQLYAGVNAITEEINFKNVSTSNTTITLEATTMPSALEATRLSLHCKLGYYGGAINGATCHVEYETGTGVDHYTYTFITTGDATIAVVIGGSSSASLKVKMNGSWVTVSKAFKKVNGSWVEADITTLFDSQTNYRRG